MNEQEAKLALVESKLSAFCDDYLTMDAEESLTALFDACEICEELNLTRGHPDIWAAAIAYAFCRMNFLLDGGSPGGLELSREEFFSFFEGCNRSTVTQKATKIERELEFHHGHPLFSLPDVVNGLPRFVELASGFIGLEEERTIEIEIASEEESRRIEEVLRQRKQLAEEEKRKRADEQKRKREEARAKKREEERKIQPELFDL
jgi:hypothetical protein